MDGVILDFGSLILESGRGIGFGPVPRGAPDLSENADQASFLAEDHGYRRPVSALELPGVLSTVHMAFSQTTVVLIPSWGVAPGYDEYGFQPNDGCANPFLGRCPRLR